MATRNISRGGLFVMCDPAEHPNLRVGTVVELMISDLECPDTTPLSIDAVIVRVECGNRKGFGLKFINVDARRAEALDRFLCSKGYPKSPRATGRRLRPPPVKRLERRANRRIDLLTQVQVSRDSECYVMASRNISRGGLYVLGDPAQHPDLKVEAVVELSIFDPDEPTCQEMKLDAMVVRVEQGARKGFGLQFINVNSETATQLDHFLSGKGYPFTLDEPRSVNGRSRGNPGRRRSVR
jgi:c-di-GMP-binding flagellar brake protein YcgR